MKIFNTMRSLLLLVLLGGAPQGSFASYSIESGKFHDIVAPVRLPTSPSVRTKFDFPLLVFEENKKTPPKKLVAEFKIKNKNHICTHYSFSLIAPQGGARIQDFRGENFSFDLFLDFEGKPTLYGGKTLSPVTKVSWPNEAVDYLRWNFLGVRGSKSLFSTSSIFVQTLESPIQYNVNSYGYIDWMFRGGRTWEFSDTMCY
ncbi:MAG: hypothetical protein GY915_08980 [bacterium]|nr:hypothetical protein [bacterium]